MSLYCSRVYNSNFDTILLPTEKEHDVIPDSLFDFKSGNDIICMKEYGVWVVKRYEDVMLKYDAYPMLVSNVKTSEKISVKNNDGRDTCAWCGGSTKKIDTGFISSYDVCVRCGK